MNDWPKVRLGEICEIIDGDRGKNYPQQEEFASKGYCLFLNASNVTKNGWSFNSNQFITKEKSFLLRKGIVEVNDIVFTTRGTVGNVAHYKRAEFDCVRINSGMVILRHREDDNRYLYYALKSKSIQQQILLYCSGSAQPQLPIKDLRKVQIPLPPLSIQHAIAKRLSAYDNLIENNRRRIAILERMAEQLYKEWFVRKRFPGHGTTAPCTELPKGWKVERLGNIIDFDPSTKCAKDNENTMIPMQALSTVSMSLDESKFTKIKGNSGSKFVNGDVLLAKITPCLENGKTGFVDCLQEGEVAVGSTEFVVMRGKTIGPCLTYCIARSAAFRAVAIGSMNGADGRQRVRVDKLRRAKHFVPSNEILMAFERREWPLFAMVRNLQRQNALLAKERDLLLPRLMSGRVKP